MKMWRSGGQKIFTKTIRNWGWDNCGGCRVFDSNNSWVSLTLLTSPVAIAIASIAYPRYIKVSLVLTLKISNIDVRKNIQVASQLVNNNILIRIE